MNKLEVFQENADAFVSQAGKSADMAEKAANCSYDAHQDSSESKRLKRLRVLMDFGEQIDLLSAASHKLRRSPVHSFRLADRLREVSDDVDSLRKMVAEVCLENSKIEATLFESFGFEALRDRLREIGQAVQELRDNETEESLNQSLIATG